MVSSQRTFLLFPPFELSLPVELCLGSRALLDSITDPPFSPALLAARALPHADPLSFPQVLGHAGRTYLRLTLPAVARSPQVVRHATRLPWLSFAGRQKVVLVFSDSDTAINYSPFKSRSCSR